MTDESTTRTQTISDQMLTLLAIATDQERGLMIGAVIATAAGIEGATPRELLARLIPEMPTDEEWRDPMAAHAERKIRNARRLYRAATIGFQMKRPQG